MQDQEKLTATVGQAIRYVGSGPDRLVRLADFLERLRTDPQWSDADIMTVRSRVSLLLQEFKSSDTTDANTSVSLLTREGGLRARFRPALTEEQYASLLQTVQLDAGNSIADTTALVKRLAQTWNCEVTIDPC